jgi:hypothetical protein
LTRRAFLLATCGAALALAVGHRLSAVNGAETGDDFQPHRADNLLEEARGDGLDLRPLPLDDEGPTFRLNGAGAYLWRHIDGTRSVETLAAQLGVAYGLARPDARRQTQDFIESLMHIGLAFDPLGRRAAVGARS